VLPFGSEKDIPAPGAASPVAPSPGPVIGADGRTPRRSTAAPYKVDPASHFPQRSEQLPSAPPAPPVDGTSISVAHIAKMSLADLRETLRARGLSPAGGLTALQERLTDALKGLPPDTPTFTPVDSGMDWPVAGEEDPRSKPASQARRSIRISASNGSGGGASSLGYALGAGGQ
jgi:hypothetical protein